MPSHKLRSFGGGGLGGESGLGPSCVLNSGQGNRETMYPFTCGRFDIEGHSGIALKSSSVLLPAQEGGRHLLQLHRDLDPVLGEAGAAHPP